MKLSEKKSGVTTPIKTRNSTFSLTVFYYFYSLSYPLQQRELFPVGTYNSRTPSAPKNPGGFPVGVTCLHCLRRARTHRLGNVHKKGDRPYRKSTQKGLLEDRWAVPGRFYRGEGRGKGRYDERVVEHS